MEPPGHQELWSRIRALTIGPADAALRFERRLARENGWTLPYAEKVVSEYRRFVLLAAVSDQPLTPSDPVDQAWHLHLAYTESYWGDLCRDVLGKRLHHGPTRGGEPEARKFERWYDRTLKLYAEVFGEEPPRDVWPPPAERFRDAAAFQRVNRATHLVLPWPRFLRGAGARSALYVLLVAGGCWGLAHRGATPTQVLTAFGGLLLAGAAIALVWPRAGARRAHRGLGGAGGAGFGACGGCGGCNHSGCGGCGGGGCGGCGGCGS